MTSLNELAINGEFEKTGESKQIPVHIDGLDSILPVYLIPLEYLYSNDENGRIAASILENGFNKSEKLNQNNNDEIGKLIIDDNPTEFKKTKKSIFEKGQIEVGYVVDDGRIIDGNRRFTALRSLQQKNSKFKYFKAVILPFSYNKKTDRAKIKKLENQFQNTERKVSYNSVDKAIDIYRTVNNPDDPTTLEEYASDSNMKYKEAEKFYNGAKYMNEFLKFIGAPQNKYSIIKDTQIWASFYEMGPKLAKYGNDIESQVIKNKTMNSYFGVILHLINVGTADDTSIRNKFRSFSKNIVETSKNQKFNSDSSDDLDDISDNLKSEIISNTTDLMKGLDKNKKLLDDFGDTFDSYMNDAKTSVSVEKFVKEIKKNVNYFEKINQNNGLSGSLRYNQFSQEQIIELKDLIRKLDVISKELFEKYGNEVE